MSLQPIVGIMGPGDGATADDNQTAYKLGKLIAKENWLLLTGGRNEGVMDAAIQGAHGGGGQTIGILPGTDEEGMSKFLDIPIFTGMGHGRNAINVHSSRIIFACGLGAGTSSEISLAVKTDTPVILLRQTEETITYFKQLAPELIHIAKDPEDAVKIAREIFAAQEEEEED